jgi:hypothetical protein
MAKQIFLAPIYGLKSLNKSVTLGEGLTLRNIRYDNSDTDLLNKANLHEGYSTLLEIDYEYDSQNPSEPYPNIQLNVTDIFEAALRLLGKGVAGVAAILPTNTSSFAGITLSNTKSRWDDYLVIKESDITTLPDYYKKFKKAYNIRPVAFDVYSKSRNRYANNDKTIDNCTALESIFVPKGEKTAKRPFILLGVKIMGFGEDEREKIRDLIAYRNTIIHADRDEQLKMLQGPKYTSKWFEETFELVREILLKYVETPWD